MKAKKDKSKNEKYVEKWFKQNGFEFTLVKQYNSKTIWDISKDGVSDKFEMLSGIENIAAYMKQFAKSFELKKEIIRLKSELAK